MRLLERDKQSFYYANYTSRTMLTDGGYVTGERSTTYGTPAEAKGTFSEPTGASTPREFGSYQDYDFIIHMDGGTCPFDEEAAIWYGTQITNAPNYRVVRIAHMRTFILVGIRQVR